MLGSHSSAVRSCVVILLLGATLTACESSRDGVGDAAPSNKPSSARARGRVESCVDRLLKKAARDEMSDEGPRRWARESFCAGFETNGWIYDDGALSIAAHTSLQQDVACARRFARARKSPRKRCDAKTWRTPAPRFLDCALLHHTRRREVRKYLERLQRKGAVECDDGTPLDNLGVP